MIRVTLDTNEYISAFAFRGRSLQLIHRALNGEIEICISEAILNETLRVLREKFEWPAYDLHSLRERLSKTCYLVEPTETVAILTDDPDNRILECAAQSRSQFLDTEDTAILRLEQYRDAVIVTLAEFAQLLGTL